MSVASRAKEWEENRRKVGQSDPKPKKKTAAKKKETE
jgi:hypothetical protein